MHYVLNSCESSYTEPRTTLVVERAAESSLVRVPEFETLLSERGDRSKAYGDDHREHDCVLDGGWS